MILRVLGGFLMALADSVPGVSGGTIAFLMGIYDEFITSLNNIVSRDREKRMAAIRFLIKLGLGWVVGMASASLVIKAVFEKNIYEISSMFIGFILVAMPIIIIEEKEEFAGKYKNIVFAVLGAALVAAVTYLSGHMSGDGIDLAWGEFSAGTGILLFICAMCAISAMVLPGISGSTLMLVFGLYQAIMTAISGTVKLQLKYVPALIIFGLGCVAGICSVVKGLKYLLAKHRSAMMYFIIGMMTGSFYAIIMGPTSLKDNPREALSFDTFSILFFAIGCMVIVGLQMLKSVFNKREQKS
ncbi:MAG: DUF368 domain-containing protein [Lachnospiraceae bacterium]